MNENFDGIFHIALAAGAALVIALSGCSGLEVGGRLGVYRVDSRSEESRTFRQSVPLKCYFTSCGSDADGEREGS